MSKERYVFNVEWFDQRAEIIRPYQLTYYLYDDTITMVDSKLHRIFLKRQKVPGCTLKQLYVGSIITIFSRQLKITDFADVFTQKALEVQKQRTFAMIKPDAYKNIGKIIQAIQGANFTISNLKMTRMTEEDANVFYGEHKGKPFFEKLVKFMTSDLIVGMELVADGAIMKWRNFIGPTNSFKAKEQAPGSIRGRFGTDGTQNAVHGSDSPDSAARELKFFFGEKSPLNTTALFNNCSCCVIKPHAVKEGNTGNIIDNLLAEGYEVSAMQMFYLDHPSVIEFLEVYQGVVPNFSKMCEVLTIGPCIAMEIRQENCVPGLRKLCGPTDPQIGKTLRKETIRAKFGQDKENNGVHCTDLEEDGILECEYFFSVLQK